MVQTYKTDRGNDEAMFKTVSFSLDEDLSHTKKDGYADFDYLRDHSYVLFEEVLYCLDYESSFGKLESGVLWRIPRHVPNGGDYLTFWGSVLEYYVSWLFETYVGRVPHAQDRDGRRTRFLCERTHLQVHYSRRNRQVQDSEPL
jgi:hypothetical protein